MRRSSLNVFSFLAVTFLALTFAQGVLAGEDDVQKHPLLQPETSWEERFSEDFPSLENKASTHLAALEIISNIGTDTKEFDAKRQFSLGTVSDAVGGALSNVVKAPVVVMEKAVGTLSGLNPLNLLHNDKDEEPNLQRVDNSVLTEELEIRSKYTNRSYDEWFANETAESLMAQRPAPKEKRTKIQVLLQNFISSKDK